ncbi:trifunctional thioredoxin/methionine sulfoxide reductase A/B protein [Neisseria gonorrhoeae]|nr:trifunctional thioredoxin/methionine sulfoxide reductase A/B protein [Neisseria gonorrhoeae]
MVCRFELPQAARRTDNGGTIAQNLNISVYPSWALIGKDGDVQRIVKGSINEAQALALIRNPNADLAV